MRARSTGRYRHPCSSTKHCRWAAVRYKTEKLEKMATKARRTLICQTPTQVIELVATPGKICSMGSPLEKSHRRSRRTPIALGLASSPKPWRNTRCNPPVFSSASRPCACGRQMESAGFQGLGRARRACTRLAIKLFTVVRLEPGIAACLFAAFLAGPAGQYVASDVLAFTFRVAVRATRR